MMKKTISLLLALLLAFAFSTTAFAAEAPEKDFIGKPNDGVDIHALLNPDNGIYYGALNHLLSYTDDGYGRYTLPQYENDRTPILWLTVGKDASVDAAGDGNLTLFSKYVLDIRKWTNMGSGFLGDDGQPNIWKTSTISAWLNNTNFTGKTLKDKLILDVVPEDFTYTGFLNSFTPSEKTGLRFSEVTTSKFSPGYGYAGTAFASWPSLLGENVSQDSTDIVYLPWMTAPATSGSYAQYGDRVWLSSRDAKDDIGYDTGIYLASADEKIGKIKDSSQPISYWGRNPSTAFDSMAVWANADGVVVNYDGASNHGGISSFNGVRPVTKLDPESILYASPVVSDAAGNPAYTQADAIYSVSSTGTNYKLTVLDSTLQISASPSGQALGGGGVVKFYGIASIYADAVVYKIVDKATGLIDGYGVAQSHVTGNAQEFAIAANDLNGDHLKAGDYAVYVWAQKNNAVNSNAGSPPVCFSMTIAPEGEGTVINVSPTGTDDLEALVTAVRGQFPLSEATSITISGSITEKDMKWLQSINGELLKLEVLDMSGATYVLGATQWTYVIPTDFMSANASQKVLHTFRGPSAISAPIDPSGNTRPDGYWLQPRAFLGVASLRSVSLPNVDRICNSAFENSGLEYIYAPDVVQMDTGAFRNCAIKELDMALPSVGWGAFEGVLTLVSVNLPNATTINGSAFWGCSNLESVNIPHVTFIGGNAFRDCTSLKSIVMPAVADIGYNAFSGDAALVEYTLGMYWPESYDSLESAFAGTYATPVYYVPKNSQFLEWGAFPGHEATMIVEQGEDADLLNVIVSNDAIKTGDAFDVSVGFNTARESNAATLTFSFAAGLFEYTCFTPAEGVTCIDEAVDGGTVKVIVALLGSYDMADLGSAGFTYKGAGEEADIHVVVDYILRDNDEKSLAHAIGGVSISAQGVVMPTEPWDNWKPGTTVAGKTEVNLLDLSNVIDWFGLDATATDWAGLIRFFDFNENGKIDIADIVYVAQQIAA